MSGRFRRMGETVVMVVREAFGDQIHVRSGFLALWALEAVVPLVLLAAVGANLFGYQDQVSEWIGQLMASSIFGSQSDSANTVFTDLVERVGPATLGITGVLSMLFVIYQLYGAALYDYSDLVRSPSGGRGWLAHALLFPVFMAFTGVLLIGGNVATGMLWARGPIWWAMPLVALSNVIIMAFGLRVFPRRTLPWTSILIGASAGAFWLELLKTAFWFYTTSGFGEQALDATYWWLGFIPIAFLWMQLLWFAVLLSAVTARVAAHYPEAMAAHERWRRDKTLPPHRWHPDERLARALWTTAQQAAESDDWISLAHLCTTLTVRPALVRDVLDVWEARGWVEGRGQGYRFTAAATDQTADDAVAAWHHGATWDASAFTSDAPPPRDAGPSA